MALAAAEGIAGLDPVCVFAVGSDGTDRSTDAAGGYVDGATSQKLLDHGMVIADVLNRKDSYSALNAVDGLIMIRPTRTNVNDLYVLLIPSD